MPTALKLNRGKRLRKLPWNLNLTNLCTTKFRYNERYIPDRQSYDKMSGASIKRNRRYSEHNSEAQTYSIHQHNEIMATRKIQNRPTRMKNL